MRSKQFIITIQPQQRFNIHLRISTTLKEYFMCSDDVLINYTPGYYYLDN